MSMASMNRAQVRRDRSTRASSQRFDHPSWTIAFGSRDQSEAEQRFTHWRIALHLTLTTLNLTRKLPTLRRLIERIDGSATDDEPGHRPRSHKCPG